MAYFDFKLNSARVKNNKEIGKAEFLIYSLVTSSNVNAGLLEGLIEADEPKKLEIIKAAANEILSYKQLIEIGNIKDNQIINFGMNGYSLFRSNSIPEFFDWNFAIMESDQGIRDFGRRLADITRHDSFDRFSIKLLTAIGRAANPQVEAAAKLVGFLTKVVAGQLLLNKDDCLAVYCESFNKYENYPALKLQAFDMKDLTGNAWVSYSIFGVN